MAERSKTPWQITRLLMLLCWFSWILTFFITVTLFQAVLQIKVVAQIAQNIEKSFMQFNTDLLNVYPLESVPLEVIDEMLVRYYVEMRYAFVPDAAEMKRRWGKGGLLEFLSVPSVYQAFSDKQGLSDDFYEKAETMQPIGVQITGIVRNKQRNYYQVYVDVYKHLNFSNWQKESKSLIMRFSYAPSRKIMGKTLSNPNGFYITSFDESVLKEGAK